jgi:ATP-binding protein involved in chromosome partitioning
VKKILGIVENMSYHVCSKCGEVSHIFGKDGAKNTGENSHCFLQLLTISLSLLLKAAKMGLHFLGEVPLHPVIRETSDAGKPITATNPSSPQAKAYFDIAKNIIERLSDQDFLKHQQGPKITIES